MDFMLLQRRDWAQRLGSSRTFPVLPECVGVKGGPLPDQSQGAAGEVALENRQAVDRDEGLALAVARVEVRRWMIPVVHADRDAKEA